MANNIQLRTDMVELLDEKYKKEALTSILDTNSELVQAGANAHEIQVAKIDMDGLANYDKANGYVDGDVTLEWETKRFNYDRGRKFGVDRTEDEESGDLAFGQLAGQFIKQKVAPEVDATRICEYSKKAGNKAENASFTDGKAVVKALRACVNTMDEAEVPEEGRVLFITPTLISMVEDLDTSASRAVLDRFSTIVRVPQSRMNMKVTLTDNGFTTTSGKEINFLAVVPEAILQIPKHEIPKFLSADDNIDADKHVYTYRTYQLFEVLDNKTDAIYVNARSLAE